MKRSKLKKEKNLEKQEKDSSYTWNPEQMLKLILSEKKSLKDNWIDEGLPKLIDRIIENYEADGGMEHIEGKDLPSSQAVTQILEDFFTIMFPGYIGKTDISTYNVKYVLGNTLNSIYSRLVEEINKSLKYVCRRAETCPEDICQRRAQVVVIELLEKLPEIRTFLRGDIQAAYDGDPAARSTDEVILSYPCVVAITVYRIAHELYVRGVPLVPRIMSEHAHSKTGIDIHPGAKIGNNFFIDHGTGVVIGETATIGDNVRIYQGVTLGAMNFPKDDEGKIIRGMKRHPTIGDDVIIYSGSTILGGETIVGNDAVICGNAWITSSIPSGTQVIIAPPELHYKEVNERDSEGTAEWSN